MSFNLAAVSEAIAEACPDREALVFRDRRFSFDDVKRRSRRLSNFLLSKGVGLHTPRHDLNNWESGQDHVALYLQNGNEYLEGMLGAAKARAASFNVNYRYVADELRYLLTNADTRAVVYHARYAPILADVLQDLPPMKALLQVADESEHDLLEGAVDYESALASASEARPDVEWSADDLYILYTGGTTGTPKGVLWRQGDILAAALGGRRRSGELIGSVEEFAERAANNTPRRYLPTPPFMHGTAQWVAFNAWHGGHCVVIQDNVERFNASELLEVIARERVNIVSLVGNAFGGPFLDALNAAPHIPGSLTTILNSAAQMTPTIKSALIEKIQGLKIVDTFGSSEAGPLAKHVASSNSAASAPPRTLGESVVLNAAMTRLEQPGHKELGWLATTGTVPLGYLSDADKTAATFPIINGVRYAVPGDRARLMAQGKIEFHGRDSSSINTGGEKVFAEEVEKAISRHASVADVLVSSRPSERWGQEVVAIVQLRPEQMATQPQIVDAAAEHIARYKLPKAVIFVETVRRHDNGKPDYRWAKHVAEGGVA